MKTAKLKNGLICVSVPKNATNFRDFTGQNNEQYQILGTITKDECSFDCIPYTEEKYSKAFVKGENGSDFEVYTNPLDSFKSMIEDETDFLFENPIENPNPKPLAYFGAIDLKIDEIEVWGKHQARVIEKLLILKTF